jgi:hypothetical protein
MDIGTIIIIILLTVILFLLIVLIEEDEINPVSLFKDILIITGLDPWFGKKPYDYGKAKWTSESPKGWFIVHAHEEDADYMYPKGEFIVDDKNIDFTLYLPNRTADFHDNNRNVILCGKCKYYPDKIVITVNKAKDKIFNMKMDRITFVREPLAP